jgi:hypothetical protein
VGVLVCPKRKWRADLKTQGVIPETAMDARGETGRKTPP